MKETMSTVTLVIGLILIISSSIVMYGEPETITTQKIISCEDSQGNKIINSKCYQEIYNPNYTKLEGISGIGFIMFILAGATKALNEITGK